MKNEIVKLQKVIKEKGIDYYIVPTSDAHNSEYVSDYNQIRRWLTGFTGSNGTLVVDEASAHLWTDGRYYIQCEKEIAGSGIKMMKMGEDVTIPEFIASSDKADITIGFDGSLMTKHLVDDLLKKCDSKNVTLKVDADLAGELWTDRPKRSSDRVKLLDINFAGKSAMDKIDEVREQMKKLNCSQFILSKLDDIMWLFNIRGGDVECNPVALSYAFVSLDDAFVFLQSDAISEAMRAYLASQRVILCDYDDIYDFITDYPYEGKTLIDDREISYRIYKCIESEDIVYSANPTSELKAIKNETEIKNMREYFLRDSAAMTKYIYYLKTNKGNITELDAARKCDELRKEVEGNLGLSFPTIAAYGANAAMMHYEATEDNYAKCKKKGMLLTDCGGQYPGATTDVTRTVAMGPVTEEEKRDFTLVLKGWLALMNAQWLEGCTGRNLDILARGPLWQAGIDYKCGTGHGVGCYLNVHEGPQNIRWKYIKDSSEAVLKPGMTVTDEPGVYIEGKYGIRTENTLLVEDRFTNGDGHFLGFENLTWVPIDMDLVDTKLLTSEEKKQLKNYQKETLKKLKGYLDKEIIEYFS